MDINLVLLKNNGEHKEFPLLTAATTIGRRSDCDLILRLMEVSRRHCQLHCDGNKLKLRDLGSSNGTLINGKKIEDETQINPGDVIQIGPVKFAVQIDGIPADFSIIGGALDSSETKTSSPPKPSPKEPESITKPKTQDKPGDGAQNISHTDASSSGSDVFSIDDSEPDSSQNVSEKIKKAPSLQQLAQNEASVDELDDSIGAESKAESSSSSSSGVLESAVNSENLPLPDDDIFGELPEVDLPEKLSESDLFEAK